MRIVLITLSLLDLLGALGLLLHIKMFWMIGIVLLIKGAMSMVGAIPAGFLDFPGFSDFFSGATLILMHAGYVSWLTNLAGLSELVKGVMMLLFSLPSRG